MRRLLIVALWLAAIAGVVVAVGLRVRANRLMDARQTLRLWLSDVPAEVSALGRVVGRDTGWVQVELCADPRWIRIFARRNHFEPIGSALTGLAAERWTLTDSKRPGAIVHLLLPSDGSPALVTATEP